MSEEPSPVDMERINEFTGGDPEQFKELTDLYLDQTRELLENLSKAIPSGDARAVEHLAHKAAGSSATCGMVLIAPILRDLENKARAGDLSDAPGLYTQICDEFRKIETFVAKTGSPQ